MEKYNILQRLDNKKKLIENYRINDRWIRVYTSSVNYFGKVSNTNLDMLLLKPSLVFEEIDDVLTTRLEEKDPTIIDINFISGVAPLREEYIKNLIEKNKGSKSTGFNQK